MIVPNMVQSISLQDPVVIVDGGYYVFYRYYATQRWYLIRNPDADLGDLSVLAEMRGAFWKHLDADLGKIRATHGVPDHQPLVFCFDCPRGEIWRNEMFPGYKGTRKTADGFPGGIFQEVQDHLGALAGREKNGVLLLRAAHCEADDIAAMVVRRIRGAGGLGGAGGPRIVCITNDNDYLQLCEADGSTRAVNLQGVDLAERNGGGDPRLGARAKVLMGDKSDEIPPVYPGVGPKTAARLALLSEGELRQHLEKKGGAAAWERYLQNQRLIDLTNTPEELLAPLAEKLTWR